MEYDVVIGLEVHVQLRTKSKMFCSCANQYGAEPNTTICPVCTGYPGVMPVPNYEAIRKTIMAGMMCECEISELSKFDRKSYFYPDMPKNYQISQYDLPFCKLGKIRISGKGFSGEALPDKDIGITRIHLEEDVAKSTHYASFSGIDYNRAGVPLMEIVSEPDMTSADEAYAYLTSLKLIMQYGAISDCDMEKGQMRCDVNISLKPKGRKEFGTKIELKNLNSFRSVHRGINHEISRQAELLDQGVALQQETRGWNDDRGATYLMRIKESAHDYRYFPEPDLTPICFSKEEIEMLRKELPELPAQMAERFVRDYELTAYDAQVLTSEKEISTYFDAGAKETKSPKLLANWIINEMLRLRDDSEFSIFEQIPFKNLARLASMISDNIISGKIGKIVFEEMYATGKDPETIVKEKVLAQVTDESAIVEFVKKAIADNPSQVTEYKAGKSAVLQYFVGQVMKLSRGKANPQSVIKLLKEQLDA
ncbi:MAG TPA: Asp-tRNA(Asn)/Glu-tRNA(Gln) amidotransferase GatCAB subunit B [Lentisphaeria bacterium]|nr:MAG: glutaminyl-tRNA synthase (glutamine-hydrolyzing) subunit B [Lentisphaerae bacterium GWF2_38_69]HBM16004.1 Asp-tRNA(Asn)/Glu-tRNA(Gln) amidotransferase GatCAB subunit B [Lentisphaeria bacterium]